jgi:hypothetical protein
MIYGVLNSDGTLSNTKEVDQNKLTSDCWMIQINGLEECEKCQFLNKRSCGGKKIRKQLLGEKKKL